MSQTETEQLDDLTWMSLVYDVTGSMGAFAGPDRNERCESPDRRHPFGSVRPPAAWIEMLWHPKTTRIVERCWKTCEACHVALAESAHDTSAALRPRFLHP